MKKKYCIMDMDGTLVDSMPYWDRLSPDYLRGSGITGDIGDIMTTIKTMTMPEACVYLKKCFSLPEEADEIRRDLDEVMRRHYAEDIPLKKGVREYLDALKEAGAKLCILTATAMPLVHLCLARLGIEPYFDFIMSCEEVGRGKNYPDAFLEAARRLGVPTEEIAVYEDSGTALKTAKNAGFYTVAVYDPLTADWKKCVEAADEVLMDWIRTPD